jgi:predicted HTH transcriptional regulator
MQPRSADFDTTPEGLLRIISQGESELVEFKSGIPPSEIIARQLVSFANSDGGILFLGINDRGEVVGLSDDDVGRAMESLQKVSASLLPWPIEIGTVDIEGKSVVYAVVDRAPRYYYPVMSSRGEVLHRQGAHNVVIPGSSLKGMLRDMATSITNEKRKATVFVAMSFREEEEPALVDYYRAMERAITETKLPMEIRRIDLVEGDFEISQQIMEEIDRSDIVIADFTLTPHNVYFELGYGGPQNQDRFSATFKVDFAPFI